MTATEPSNTFDPDFDAGTGWDLARRRAAEVLARWRAEGVMCRKRGCERHVLDGYPVCRQCVEAITDRVILVRIADEEMFCGLCDTPVMVLWRNDAPRDRKWVIESSGHRDGRCRVEEGGFTVLSPDAATKHGTWKEAPPLFRTHPPVCGGIVSLRAAGLISWTSNGD